MKYPRFRFFALPLLLAGITSCGGGSDGGGGTGPPPPSVPTSITITQNSVTLTFLGATITLTATIRDQNGAPISGTITWSSSDPSVVTIDGASGLLTAIKNGTATITATSGNLSATLTVSVEQVASLLALVSGDGQTATVGQALAEALSVRADDAGGAPVEGVSLTFTVSSGGGTVGTSPVVTDAQGLASTTWTLGTTAGLQQLDVSVGQGSPLLQISATGLAAAAAGIVKSSGDTQTGPINLSLSGPIVVQVQDQFGNGVEGSQVGFAVTGGGGSVNPATATSDVDGNAQTVWTMGPAVGPAELTVTLTGFPPVSFTAIAELATPDLVAGALSVAPANPTEQQTLTVTVPVTNSGTATTGGTFTVQLLVDGVDAAAQTAGALATQIIGPLAPTQTANAEFTVGPFASGTRAFSAIVDVNGDITESDETNNTSNKSVAIVAQAALTAGTPIPNVGGTCTIPPPGNCATTGGDELLFGFQFPVADGQSIEFKLSGGTGDADMYVNYNDRPASRDDYERVSGAADSNESVRYEAALAGVYHVLLHAFTDFSGTTLTVTTGLAVLPYNIELVFINAGTSTQNAAFTGAATRWEALLPIDITDIPFLNQPVEANSACGSSFQHPPIEDTVDDLRIFADIIEIDGPGGTLGQAGPCLIRSSSGLPVVGFMQFDEADLANLEAQGRLGSVILHEMGHVLGIGTVWGPGGADLLRDPSFGNPGQDTHFVGPLAIQAFDDAGGLLYGGQKVPVENSGVAGSTDGHWREIVMLLELFTPTLNAGFNPLSAISVQSLADVGYRVDATAADAYTITLPAAAAAAAPGPVIDLGGDIWRGPLMEVDGQGRIIRVIRR